MQNKVLKSKHGRIIHNSLWYNIRANEQEDHTSGTCYLQHLETLKAIPLTECFQEQQVTYLALEEK